MRLHRNAKSTPAGRAELVRRVVELHRSRGAVAAAMGVSTRTAFKWLARFRAEGPAGFADRSSAARRRPHATPPAVIAAMVRLRRQRWTGQQIARATGRSPATVAKHLKRLGLARLSALEPSEPARR
jgi:transposase